MTTESSIKISENRMNATNDKSLQGIMGKSHHSHEHNTRVESAY